jgi:hypothetical protein
MLIHQTTAMSPGAQEYTCTGKHSQMGDVKTATLYGQDNVSDNNAKNDHNLWDLVQGIIWNQRQCIKVAPSTARLLFLACCIYRARARANVDY